VKAGEKLLEESAEDLFENAPCGYLTTTLDGSILRVNRTFESWTGLRREDLVGERRFQDLLTGPGRIYHETHYSPLLRMQGSASQIALEIVGADGSRRPALVNSVVVENERGDKVIRTVVFDAGDRRRYEEELLRARRHEQEIARLLQRSMLTGEMPEMDGIEVGACYRPAVAGTEVGGDWYDAFPLGDGEVGLVVGDVVGRGVGAAATMGQLRSALRALASTGLRPAALLEALDAYAERHGVGTLATVLFAHVDLKARELRFACAGHLPPLFAAGEDRPRLAWEGRSTPLGVHLPGVGPRPEAAIPLPRGSLVVLFSDGLVERRGGSIDAAMERLAGAVEQRREEAPAELAPSLVRAFEERDRSDDVCLLAAAIQ
jgi:sigma-B regulation protein RsbU (phosphoserine phosphatase)